MNWKKRQYCETLTLKRAGETVHVCGWIDTIRDHGQLLFAHIRDVTGEAQMVFNPETNPEIHKIGESLRNEYTVSIEGQVVERAAEAKNPSMPTGDIEIHVTKIEVLSQSKTPPFMITEKKQTDEESTDFNVDEDLRLKYRYLDLRRPSMQQKLKMRYRMIKTIRDYLDDYGFCDVETPMLTKSTPEGARDYLVPSRHHLTKFYALPQSPQLFKQLLMVSGLDRYYQIVKCFRDEDLRPNRQPEFTQLDLEASFIDESFIYELIEGLLIKLYGLVNKKLEGPFPHITYDDAMNRFGNDRPDLRFEMELTDVSPLLKDVNYKIFNSILANGGLIKGINVKGKADDMSKSFLQEELAKKIVPKFGAKGMSWMKVEGGKLQSNIVQFFNDDEQAALIKTMSAEDGDVLLFIADTNHALVNDVLGRLRLHVGEKFGFIDKNKVAACWVTDFPMFELTREGQVTSIHHPFTQPSEGIMNAKTKEELLKLKSRAYDVVVNGEELGGGSIRIHDSNVQQKIFALLGMDESEINAKFGFFVNALQYGTPPHGGIALGIDRVVSMILNEDSIREVIAFPKNRVAYCPLTQAPSDVSEEQLKELAIKKLELEPAEA